MKTIAQKGNRIKQRLLMQTMTEEQIHFEEEMATIQALIGLGMKAAEERIQKEFKTLVGTRYEHGKAYGP